MTRGKRITLISLAVIALAVFAIANTTGIYVVNPIATVPEGESIWYFRRGLGLPMIASADGLNDSYGNGVSANTRGIMNTKIATIIGRKVIAKFPYSKPLYMLSTRNKDFSALGAPMPAKTQTPKP